MGTHALLSPSKRYRWANCPGSIREEKKYPVEKSGPSAIDGTHTHTLLEQCIGTDRSADTYLAEQLRDHEGEFTVEPDRIERVQVCLDYVASRITEYNGMCEVRSETKVSPEWLLGRTDMSGTVDVTIIGGDMLELIDYKDGMNDAWDSAVLQLEQYAYGVLAGYKIPINQAYPFTRIRMTVVQPKLAIKGGKAIRSIETTVQELLAKSGVIVAQAARTEDPDAPLIPGDLQCKYCPVTACAARAQKAMDAIGVMFQPIEETHVNLPVPPQDMFLQAAEKDPHKMTSEQLAQIMEAAPMVRQLIENTEAEVLSRLTQGIAVPGFKLVNGRGSRAWALPEEEMAERLIKMGVPKGSVYETKIVSPAKVEKLKWSAKKGGEEIQKQLTDRQLSTLDKEYIVKTAGKLTVAPESDSRPAVTTDAQALFAPIVEENALPDWMK